MSGHKQWLLEVIEEYKKYLDRIHIGYDAAPYEKLKKLEEYQLEEIADTLIALAEENG